MLRFAVPLLAMALIGGQPAVAAERPRFRDAGFAVGTLPTGPFNAITDVAGVTVGQVTRVEGDTIRTGVTAIVPHGGNVFQDKLPAAYFAPTASASSPDRRRSRNSARSRRRSC